MKRSYLKLPIRRLQGNFEYSFEAIRDRWASGVGKGLLKSCGQMVIFTPGMFLETV